MPEFFLELFSEEIPARMQAGAEVELARFCHAALGGLSVRIAHTWSGPRRIALAADVAAEKPGGMVEARGPRDSAPEAALVGFMNRHKATSEALVVEAGYYWLRRREPPEPAAQVVLASLPPVLARFAWPKSMRWGQSGEFTWVRPLRRIVCLLDGAPVPIVLGPVVAGDETEGHRFMSPGPIRVSSGEDWAEKLRKRNVLVDRAERRRAVVEGLTEKAAALGLRLVEDDALADEVTGLVEWPVPLIGQVGAEFMALPPEVRELSMKVNQRYFALRDAAGMPAPYFAFVANIAAADGGAAIIAGNERVLRARLADARHFWEQDLRTPLDVLLPKLNEIVFHAKIGTQRQRAERIASGAAEIARRMGADPALAAEAETAGRLAKVDLVTAMVGEFPELQGIMGGYYAEKNPGNFDPAIVAPAIRTHYQPRGPHDAVPRGIVPISVALADKLDTLTQFFRIGEKPTGSGDPFALRRAALGVIRIILENQLSLPLRPLIPGEQEPALFDFIIERLRVKLRGEGERYDVLDAVLGAGEDDDLNRLMQRVHAVSEFLATADGANLLAAYRRAANILRIEDAKDGPHLASELSDEAELRAPEAEALREALLRADVGADYAAGDYRAVMRFLARLRGLVDAFFDRVTVNDPIPSLRINRLRLLARLRDTMHLVADFSKIEG